MLSRILAHLREFLLHIIYLSIIGVLVAIGLFEEVELNVSLILIGAAIIGALLITLLMIWLSRSYDEQFDNERDALPRLRRILRSNNTYESIRVCGTSCTSIFELFEDYALAIANKKRVYVCILNPNEDKVIEYLREAEAREAEVVSFVRTRLPALRGKISEDSYSRIEELLLDSNPYGKKLIVASILLWLEARNYAHRKVGGLSNGLEVHLYSQLPTLKAWIFGEDAIFLGSYGPMPGRVGIVNPIHFIRSRRRNGREKINSCRSTVSYLLSHPKTKFVKSSEDLYALL